MNDTQNNTNFYQIFYKRNGRGWVKGGILEPRQYAGYAESFGFLDCDGTTEMELLHSLKSSESLIEFDRDSTNYRLVLNGEFAESISNEVQP